MSIDLKTCTISVIIPSLDEETQIGQTVAGLLSRAAERNRLEVIVADGGSRDQTRKLAASAGAKIIAAARGRGRQQKAGADAASGEIFLFLHADTEPPEGFDSLIRMALAPPEVAAGAFRLAIKAEGRCLRLIEWFANLRSAWLDLPYGDQALFMRAEPYRQVGGFAAVSLLEDLDLIRRLAKIGKIVLLAESVRCSARRWLALGPIKTSLLNQAILLGFFCGLRPERLAGWYRLALGNRRDGRKQMTMELAVTDKG